MIAGPLVGQLDKASKDMQHFIVCREMSEIFGIEKCKQTFLKNKKLDFGVVVLEISI